MNLDEEEQRFMRLSDALRVVAEEDRALQASPAVEGRLRMEVRSIGRARRRRRAYAAIAFTAAVSAIVVVPGRGLWQRLAQAPGATNGRSAKGTSAAAQEREVTTAFLPLAYSSVPLSGGELVRLDVPRSTLVSFGLAPIEALDVPGAGTVQADVLVGEDGLARAIRFVRPVAQASAP